MLRRPTAILVGAALVAALALHGCGGSDMYGEPLSDIPVTSVSDVLDAPLSFEGETVKIKGEIANECPSGCWFELREGNAVVFVDLAPHGLAIPQFVGRTVIAEGEIALEDGRPRLLAKGVEIL
jgi:hypothetical protein